jgi:hypothetical protein
MKLATLLLCISLISICAAKSISDDDLGPFGIGSCHTNNRSMHDNSRWIPQMEAIGLRYYRTCQTSWSAVEPSEGEWHWETLDQQMDYLTEHHFSFGGMLIGNPRWNTHDEPGHLPVNNLSGWSKYVSKVVEHSQGKVKRWEVWNEPPNFTGKDQTPADYAKIVVSAYDAAKAADPDCLVGLAAKSVHLNYLEQVIDAGAKDHFDFITLHPYEVLDGIAENVGTEALFLHIVPTTRKMLAARNPAKANVPIIFTELGCDLNKGADVQASTLVKAYTMSIAQGVACVHWFEGMDGDSGPLGLLDRNAQPRPAYTAMAQMIQSLGQHPNYQGWVMLNSQHPGFVFTDEKAPVLITWNQTKDADVVDFGQSVQIMNPITGNRTRAESYELTTSPVIIRDFPDALGTQARANKSKPFLWGGDFSKAKSVSITMGDAPTEQGLHTLSGEAVARSVIGYGGSARAGSVPGGNLFVVDPGFLSYTTEPIKITAVVRRNEANDNSGFKLVYESIEGFKTAGNWYTIPDNKQWHTVSWQIDDPQFVSYWGYNFSLVSDGDVYNKYYIQSVTVTKSSN